MAVTKIRKISRWTLYVVTVISLLMLALFFFGGVGEPLGANGDAKNPIYTGELLYWCYILLVVCAIGMLTFGITQFASKLISNPKASIVTLGVFVAFALLLILAYSLGDGNLLSELNPNSDAQKFNVPFWLKVTDMWLYSMYTLAFLAIMAMVWGSVKKISGK